MERAIGVVAMGGYNTFCEILSFDKRALIVPRTQPRLEQYIRTARAAELGLVTMLEDDGTRAPRLMAEALRSLPERARPSSVVIPGLLDGLDTVNRLAAHWLYRQSAQPGLIALRG
jgi:predicted glycosyltransferase